jgi:hypothetical protein
MEIAVFIAIVVIVLAGAVNGVAPSAVQQTPRWDAGANVKGGDVRGRQRRIASPEPAIDIVDPPRMGWDDLYTSYRPDRLDQRARCRNTADASAARPGMARTLPRCCAGRGWRTVRRSCGRWTPVTSSPLSCRGNPAQNLGVPCQWPVFACGAVGEHVVACVHEGRVAPPVAWSRPSSNLWQFFSVDHGSATRARSARIRLCCGTGTRFACSI